MNKFKRLIKLINEGKVFDFLYHLNNKIHCRSQKNVFEKQNKLLNRILKYSIKHCPFYSSLKIDHLKKINLSDFPIIDKQTIRGNPNTISGFVSDKINKMIVYKGFTGGSTGEPLSLILTPGIDHLFQNEVWKMLGYKKGDIVLAMDGTKLSQIDLQNKSYLTKISDKQLPYGGYALSSLYLTDDNIGNYVESIKKLKPSYIRGYPSFVYSVAKYINDNNINVDLKLKGIELTSETAFSYQIELIKSVFNTRVILQYGHTEAIAFGYTYDDSFTYRVEPLYGYVEVLDKNGNQVGVGETGEIVVTTLYNRAMPLIRYRTGDRAVYGGKDERFVYLKTIFGRTQDYIVGKNGEKVLLTALIFAQHFHALANIKKWQLEQYDIGVVIAHIIKEKDYSKKDEEEISSLFDNNGNVKTEFDYVEEIKTTQRGKSLMLIQHIK